jgi:ATP-binding cassette subfamily B protein
VFFRYLIGDPRAAKEMRLFEFGDFVHQRLLDTLYESADRVTRLRRRQATTQVGLALLGGSVTAIGLVIVVRGVTTHKFTIGDIALFTAAVATIQGTLAGLITQIGQIRGALDLFETYVDVITIPDDLPDGGVSPRVLSEGIAFENVWFRYDETSPWVFSGLNLSIPKGEILGIVGLNGAGKTTFIKLLCRFYDPVQGRITWDGEDIRSLDLLDLRRRLTAIFQDYGQYDISAAQNIALGAIETMEQRSLIEDAAMMANIHEALAALPHGYDTMLSRTFQDDEVSSAMLSGGQWQRVALARGFIREDADVLIFDEPSSSLDPFAEERLRDTLEQHRAGKTIVLATHRLSALRDASCIALFARGVVAELGSHDDLMSRDGAYAQLFRTQGRRYQLVDREGLKAGMVDEIVLD